MSGRLTVIVGSMFSGKSTRWIARMNSERVSGQKIQTFIPDIPELHGGSRNGSTWNFNGRWEPKKAARNLEILLYTDNPSGEIFRNFTIGFEEAQFFPKEFAEALNVARVKVEANFVVSGLSRDYLGNPFGCIPTLLWMADEIIQCRAICNSCRSRDGTRTIRVDENKDLVVIGSNGYQSRCHMCCDI